ncbi:unnamed protein product [Gemmata massiliana]|uniref:TIGR03067 domain-containing protein n=1 Tax=Gemmata massiliana TaxID=1210884 RepID=A0A6P2CWF5_9BACT|nr:TIGR03067 domain-containing protein [Gemmata massiliana]VTR91432.1 unnamed protein product [Gemmata massiliana]
MRPVMVVAVLALAGFTARADEKDAAKRLEGTYEVVEVLVAGKPDAKKDEVKSFEIKDGELIIKLDKRNETAKFTLDPSKKPGHIDLTSKNDMKIEGIYEAKETDKGLELTIAFAHGGKSERPKDFKGQGESDTVIKLFRKK